MKVIKNYIKIFLVLLPILGASSVLIYWNSDSNQQVSTIPASFQLKSFANYFSGDTATISNEDPPFMKMDASHWVDSVFNSLDRTQQLGQLFMLGIYSNMNKRYEDSIANSVCN